MKSYLWTAGEEGLDEDVGVVHFKVVVPKASGDADGSQHTSLRQSQETQVYSNYLLFGHFCWS